MASLTENLRTAIYDGRTDIILSLLSQNDNFENNKLIHHRIDNDGTMLHIASKLGNQDLIRALLQCDADTTLVNQKGITPIKMCISSKVQQLYIDELFRRISKNDIDYIAKLIKGGVDINTSITSLDHNTCLHWAAIFSTPDVIKFLKDNGAHINIVNDKGLTPLHEAILANKVANVQALLSIGTELTAPSTGKYAGKSLLQLASGHDPAILALIREHNDKLKKTDQTVTFHPGGCLTNGTPAVTNPPDLSSTLDGTQMDMDQMSLNGPTPTLAGNHVNGDVASSVGSASGPDPNPIPLTEAEIREHDFLKVLWPRPRQIYTGRADRDSFVLPPNVNICLVSHVTSVTCIKMWEVWEIFRESFSALGSVLLMQPPSMRSESNIVCLVDERIFPKEQGYKLVVTDKQIKLIVRDIQGMYYGISTIREILRATPEFILPQFVIIDWPAFQTRGIVLDISRGKVPKIGGLTRIIDSLAGLKLNKIYLSTMFNAEKREDSYIENWQVSYSAMDILFLERYCQECCVQLVPALDVEEGVGKEDLKLLRYPIQRYLDSFTCFREIYIGPELCALFTSEGSTEPSFSLESFFFPTGRSNHHVSLILDWKKVRATDVAQKSLATFSPDTVLGLHCETGGNSSFATTLKILQNDGLSHVLIVDSVWGTSVAGNYRRDFPHNLSMDEFGHVFKDASSNVPVDPSFDNLGIIGDLGCSAPNFVDYLFAWPLIMSLAACGWTSKTLAFNDEANKDLLPSILSWHIFPQDVECVLSRSLLELASIEYETSDSNCTVGTRMETASPLSKDSFYYDILTKPEDIDLRHFTGDLFNRISKGLKKIQNALAASQRPIHGGPVTAKDERLPSYLLTIELMSFGCRLAKCLIAAGTHPDTGSLPQPPIINVGLSNINAIHKTDLANKLLDIIKMFKANWLEQNLEENMASTVTVLEKLFKQLAPESDAEM